ncbi:expressed protein [Phakopsora pachyrhizi]|uniref:Expressed protein n=1 Tax=Phakopsora pachyrhizi TaxID=170000 RepID=A0AAV0B8R0_PHAPC|nr:expressed protein [Phakopsora pachyrhizi]
MKDLKKVIKKALGSLYYARKSKKARSYRQKAMGLISTKEAKQMFWFLPKIDKPTCNQGQVRCKDITYVHFGRNVFYLKQGRVFMGIAEFLPFSEMSDSEFNDWNEVTKTLFNEKRIVREIRSASNSSSGSMFSTGWRKSSVKSELYGLTINKKKVQRNKELWEARKAKLEKVEAVLSSSFSNVADVLFTTARETFQQSGAPSFSSVSKSDKNTQNSFGSCLTATYGGFSNEPQISSDFHEVGASWWVQVNKKTGQISKDPSEFVKGGKFTFPNEKLEIDFSKTDGICQVFWMKNKFYHQILPSIDTKTDTRLCITVHTSKRLVNAVKKNYAGEFENKSDVYVKDSLYIVDQLK